MNKTNLKKFISKHDFSFNQQLFTETDAIVDIAIKAGENSADIENLEEQHEEITEKLESVERSQKWNDESIDRLYNRLYELEQKINETKEEVIEEVEEVEEKTEEETVIEKTEEEIPVEKNSNGIVTIIGTAIIGAIVIAVVKMFEEKRGED